MAGIHPNLIYAQLRVRNLERSVRFYRTLGLTPKGRAEMEDGGSLVWVWDKRTRMIIELEHVPRGSDRYEGFRRKGMSDHGLVFTMPDSKTILPKLYRLGGKLFKSFYIGDIQVTVVRDPDGHYVEVLSWTKVEQHPREGGPMLSWALKD